LKTLHEPLYSAVPKSIVILLGAAILLAGCGGSTETVSQARPSAAPRATYSFNLSTTAGASYRVQLSYSNEDSYYKYYEGTWRGMNIRFADSPAVSSISIWNGNLAIASYSLTNYHVSDFGSVTKQTLDGQYSYYDTVSKTQIKFKLSPATVSP